MSVTILDQPFDPEAALATFRRAHSDAGAISSFTGCVRDDGGTQALTLSHYPGFTEAQIQTVLDHAHTRWALIGATIIHRVGEMRPTEPIVFVATAAAHRRAAFEACDYLMDRLKSDAPFWKSETRDGQTNWIEPRAQDARDLKRWG